MQGAVFNIESEEAGTCLALKKKKKKGKAYPIYKEVKTKNLDY